MLKSSGLKAGKCVLGAWLAGSPPAPWPAGFPVITKRQVNCRTSAEELFLPFSYRRKRAVEEGTSCICICICCRERTDADSGCCPPVAMHWAQRPAMQKVWGRGIWVALGGLGQPLGKGAEDGVGTQMVCPTGNVAKSFTSTFSGYQHTYIYNRKPYICDFIVIKKFRPTSYKHNRDQSKTATCLKWSTCCLWTLWGKRTGSQCVRAPCHGTGISRNIKLFYLCSQNNQYWCLI